MKLTPDSAKVLRDGQTVRMKLAKEAEREEKSGGAAAKKRGRRGLSGEQSFGAGEESLFEKLRALRMEIAREEKVPPYIVFSDKTLTHMCIVKPRTRAEMLSVSGVGEFKYEKYGERFLACVREALGT